MTPHHEIKCRSCNASFFLSEEKGPTPHNCPFCGSILPAELDSEISSGVDESASAKSLVHETSPDPSEILFEVGSYQILKKIGQGGMGEVYLAYDTECGRRLAIKRIRTDRKNIGRLTSRFLKEARVTAQLTHPSIIPIYAISTIGEELFYTMPHIEGFTLKDILLDARRRQRKGETTEEGISSIASLTRTFLQVCQAIAYAHSQEILHRDIKGSNVIIGKFGEVVLLDWGLAQPVPEPLDERPEYLPSKVAGTLPYLAPERLLGYPASRSTEVFALGVLLYNILTLNHPFPRKTIKKAQDELPQEDPPLPSKCAPTRNIPPHLEHICMRCIESDPSKRIQTVQQLISELQFFLEGRSAWREVARLEMEHKSDWQFQENVLIAEHTAITSTPEESNWVSLMISKGSYPGNVRVETEITLGERGEGIGILLQVPEQEERRHLNDGYCLWIGNEETRTTKLLRSTVEVLQVPDAYLVAGKKTHLVVEIVDSSFHLFIDGALHISYVSHLPLAGTHLGVLARDADFALKPLIISTGSESLQVSCLAIPDAFLAHQDYEKAFIEYKRIAYSFPGRQEGQKALFKAGITLIERAKRESDQEARNAFFAEAIDTFDALAETPASPLSFLGKALTYETQDEVEEEIKCYHMAFRKCAKKPSLNAVKEQVLHRIHECAKNNRHATYELAYIISKHLPKESREAATYKLFSNMQRHWEELPYLKEDPYIHHVGRINLLHFALLLSFWLGKPFFITEVLRSLAKSKVFPLKTASNALYLLLKLQAPSLYKRSMEMLLSLEEEKVKEALLAETEALTFVAEGLQEDFSKATQKLAKVPFSLRSLSLLVERGFERGEFTVCQELLEKMRRETLSDEEQFALDQLFLKSALWQGNLLEAKERIALHSLEEWTNSECPAHFLYGCYLAALEGEELAKVHFTGVVPSAFPRSWHLATLYISGALYEGHRWYAHAFPHERRILYRDLALFHHCAGDLEKSREQLSLCKSLLSE